MDRVRVKSVEGSVIETHGNIQTGIREGGIDIPFRFQLVGKQVDLKGDGMPGRVLFEINAGPNLLQGMIPDLPKRRLCNTHEVNTFTRAGTRSTSRSSGR